MYKSDFTNPARYDLNVKIRYQNIFREGASCRFNDTFGLGLGLDITNNLKVGYLYDLDISKNISSYFRGSHEFCIGFKFLKDKQRVGPRMSWWWLPVQSIPFRSWLLVNDLKKFSRSVLSCSLRFRGLDNNESRLTG
ncbi:type IX secretion system membrane protein PorP/SprF [Pseudobacter ginsenosidimutans]|nr:type IX secretion system membrane protein PorP/SprF [Pseudobacter ginsenosidimutans]